MSLLNTLRLAARKVGLEVHRYNVAQSLDARFLSMLGLHDVDLVIDVGANDGGYGQFLRRGGYSGPILSFEPLADAHAALRVQAARDPTWTVGPRCALGASGATASIHVAGNSRSSSLLPMMAAHVSAAPDSATLTTESVEVQRLDDVEVHMLKMCKRALLKIDTQGYELPVLQGGESTLPRCVGVQLEMSLVPLYEGQAMYRDLIDWLQLRGFELWALLPGFSDPKTGRMLQCDGVFFRHSAPLGSDRQQGPV
jgi:FkbM family methyltransferase